MASEAPKQEMIDGMDKWKVEDAAETLQRAMEIKKDKKLLKAGLKVLKQKAQATQQARDWAENLTK